MLDRFRAEPFVEEVGWASPFEGTNNWTVELANGTGFLPADQGDSAYFRVLGPGKQDNHNPGNYWSTIGLPADRHEKTRPNSDKLPEFFNHGNRRYHVSVWSSGKFARPCLQPRNLSSRGISLEHPAKTLATMQWRTSGSRIAAEFFPDTLFSAGYLEESI